MNAMRWMLAMLLLSALPAQATTWVDDTVQDPVSGKPCNVKTPASFGSYVYQWPEKYDQVFWPLTDPMGIWVCAASGFAAFIGDVELGGEEKRAIAAFLKDAPALPEKAPLAAKLERLEAVYALRQLTPDVRARIQRAIAYQYEADGQQAKADALRAAAGALIASRLQDPALAPDLRLQYVFVTANYARERGDVAESDRQLDALAPQLAEAAKDEKLKDSARNIVPGGALAPQP